MSKRTPEFLDRFIAHLALQLLTNVQWMEEWFAGQRRHLYWRSPVIKQQGLGFIDGTLELNPTPMLRLGFFFHATTTTESSRYLQCYPLTQDQLDQHVHSIGLDIESGPPEAMAKMMANALASDTVQAQVHDNTITCRWFYPEIQDHGECVNWPIQYQSTFDAVATTLLFQNLNMMGTILGQEKQQVSASEEILVDRYLQECLDRQQQQQQQRPEEAKSDTVGSEPVISTTSDSSRNKRPLSRRGPNVVAVASKSRKKKSKIMYCAEPHNEEPHDSTNA